MVYSSPIQLPALQRCIWRRFGCHSPPVSSVAVARAGLRTRAGRGSQLNGHVTVSPDQTEPDGDIDSTISAEEGSLGDLGDPLLPAPGAAAAGRPRLIQHVFRWGVGNAFRADSRNRFRPVHVERNTVVSLREDYFACDLTFERCRITYDRLNEQWEVLWHECGKLNGKPFPIKKFGIEAAKAESAAFAQQLDKRLREQVPPEREIPDEPGLTFDNTLHCWVALGRVAGRPATRAFSADFHGYENAHKLASDFKST